MAVLLWKRRLRADLQQRVEHRLRDLEDARRGLVALLELDQPRRFLVEVDARLLGDRGPGVARDRRRLVGSEAGALHANADRGERRSVGVGDVDAPGTGPPRPENLGFARRAK